MIVKMWILLIQTVQSWCLQEMEEGLVPPVHHHHHISKEIGTMMENMEMMMRPIIEGKDLKPYILPLPGSEISPFIYGILKR